MGYTYILRCSDGSFYVGSTTNILKRLSNHQNGQVRYTKSRLPIEPIFIKRFSSYQEARLFENTIKSWKKRRSIKKMLDKQDNIVSGYN